MYILVFFFCTAPQQAEEGSDSNARVVYPQKSFPVTLSFSLPTDNVPKQGGAPQHMSLQCAHSVTHPIAEMHHSSDPLSAATTHLSRYSSTGS